MEQDIDCAVLGAGDEAEEAGYHVGEDEEEKEDVGPRVTHGGIIPVGMGRFLELHPVR